MNTLINTTPPTTMHIDINSCFATIEQQANPLLRGKTVAVAAYATPNGCILAASIEAKRLGIKTGMRVKDGRKIDSNLVVLTPDPPKYRDVHLKFRKILEDYSPKVSPKSIDEAVIDFTGTGALKKGLVETGQEIKERIFKEIGEWMFCNVGIGPNRFLAKLAAGLNKPDGLDVISHKNLVETYQKLKLTDLHGINVRYQRRLNKVGIYTPLDFLNANYLTLKHRVFQSISGYYWYMRLRGWEIDDIQFKRKTVGQSYALPKPTNNNAEISRILMKLCEKMGRRLRHSKLKADGIHIGCLYNDGTYWHQGRKQQVPMYSTQQLYNQSKNILTQQPNPKQIANLAVRCYLLKTTEYEQLNLFEQLYDERINDSYRKQKELAQALDKINDRYGEFAITSGLMMNMTDKVIDRISFGGIHELNGIQTAASV